jgi:hypothetical protein
MPGLRIAASMTVIFCCWWPTSVQAGVTAAELTKETVEAFERYIRQKEAQLDERLNGSRNFLWVDDSAERRQEVRKEGVVTQVLRRNHDVPGGLIHDWIGATFVPGATLKQTLALVQDYNSHKRIYQPEVIDSGIHSHRGNEYKTRLRLLKKKILTVVLNTEHDIRYFPLDQTRWHSRSYTTRIAEVADYGKPNERELPVGKDHGFLWRLYAYWKFQERDGGVYIECEAISLTRDVPAGLGWLVKPIIRDLPKESLARTLRTTRTALLRQNQKILVQHFGAEQCTGLCL